MCVQQQVCSPTVDGMKAERSSRRTMDQVQLSAQDDGKADYCCGDSLPYTGAASMVFNLHFLQIKLMRRRALSYFERWTGFERNLCEKLK